MSSVFPIENLPSELQVLILVKCEVTAIRILINLSPSIKGAFLQYPETHLRQILRNLPDLVGGLYCLLWTLDTIPHRHLDWPFIVDWLHVTFTVGEKLIWDDWTFFRTDYLELLYELADVVEQVSSIVELYAESTLALLDTVSQPEASHSQIKLSPTEYNRIASALCLLKIYGRFVSFGGTPDKFRTIIPEWQTEQMLTVKTFLVDVGRPTRSSLYYLVDEKYRCGNILREPSYQSWGPDAYGPWEVAWMPGRLAGMNPYGLHARRYFANILFRPPFPNDEDMVTGVVEGLPNYARNNIERITADVGLLPYYRQIFIQLGLFFWDDDRFLHLPLTDADEYEALILRYEDACDRGIAKAYDGIYRDNTVAGYYSDKVLGYRVDPEDLKRWTRCPVQCTFGEWMARNYDAHYD